MRSASTRRSILSGRHAANCPRILPLQGNLDPLALFAGGDALAAAVAHIRSALAQRPHVFNLGHGIGQFTPIAHVEQLVRLLGKAQ